MHFLFCFCFLKTGLEKRKLKKQKHDETLKHTFHAASSNKSLFKDHLELFIYDSFINYVLLSCF